MGAGPHWNSDDALSATVEAGQVRLAWRPAAGASVAGYNVHRAEDNGEAQVIEAVKSARFLDRNVLGGLRYTYFVMAYDSSGRHSPPSNSVTIEMPMPEAAPTRSPQATHAH